MITTLLVTLPFFVAFPETPNTERNLATPRMPPQLAAVQSQLPPDFSATVFAAEPDVQNPIAMAWDARGRLWVAENYTYAERTQRFDLSLRDRVLIFTDNNLDGVADRRSVFTDELQMLTSIEVGAGGVWLMCPPYLLFLPDRDGDDRPDGPAQVKLDGFDVAEANYHNFANGLRFGPDGWLYGRCGGSCPARIGPPGCPPEQRMALEGGVWRYHPTRKTVEVLATGTTNPWGHDWNQFYEAFFVNTVNGHLWHLIPGSHLTRPFTLDPNPHTYELIDLHADHWHFDTSGQWQDSRDGAANRFGGGHAHSGTSIYLGGLWPVAYHDRLLTLNFHGRRANQERLNRRGSGYVGSHEPDFFLSRDPWFRGMDLSYGPDGNVFVLDWSDTGECHENTGVHRTSGRVYKISYQRGKLSANERLARGSGLTPAIAGDLTNASDHDLALAHRAPNEWFVRQARLELTRRQQMARQRDGHPIEHAAIDFLNETLWSAEANAAHRLRAALTLFCLDRLDQQRCTQLLGDKNPHLRVWAVRLLLDQSPIDDAIQPSFSRAATNTIPRTEYAAIARDLAEIAANDPNSMVRLAIASALQRLPTDLRSPIASALVTHVKDAHDHNLPLMVWYGLIHAAQAHPAAVADVAGHCEWRTTRRLIARRLGELIQVSPEGVDRLIELATQRRSPEFTIDILTGLQLGLKGFRQARRPARWQEFRRQLDVPSMASSKQLAQQLSVVFGDGRALQDVVRTAMDSGADFAARRAALQTLIAQRAPELRSTCLKLLREQRLNLLAAHGLALFADRTIGETLVDNYARFRSPFRPQIVSILVSRIEFAGPLLAGIEQGKIPINHLTAFDVRQINSLGDKHLSDQARQLWGEVRETDADKSHLISQWKKRLTTRSLAKADKAKGRVLFRETCAKCHRMYGEGQLIGPDLTGANRNDLDYLLENILAPSVVVGKDYRMSILELADGRVLNGLVITENENTVTLQTQTDQTVIRKQDVENRTLTHLSPMPDGLLNALSPADVCSLIAYLQHPSQVPLPAPDTN